MNITEAKIEVEIGNEAFELEKAEIDGEICICIKDTESSAVYVYVDNLEDFCDALDNFKKLIS